jgi:hypothetical protein
MHGNEEMPTKKGLRQEESKPKEEMERPNYFNST